MDALTKEEREVVDWVRATSASKALKWSQEPGEWINRAELLLETVDRLCARLALASATVEAARKARTSAHVCFLQAADLMVRAGPDLLSATEIQTFLKDSAVAHADSDAWVAALAAYDKGA